MRRLSDIAKEQQRLNRLQRLQCLDKVKQKRLLVKKKIQLGELLIEVGLGYYSREGLLVLLQKTATKSPSAASTKEY